MIELLMLLNKEENEDFVTEILRPIYEGDQLTEDVIKSNLSKLDLLVAIGEKKIYDALIQELLDDDVYKEYM